MCATQGARDRAGVIFLGLIVRQRRESSRQIKYKAPTRECKDVGNLTMETVQLPGGSCIQSEYFLEYFWSIRHFLESELVREHKKIVPAWGTIYAKGQGERTGLRNCMGLCIGSPGDR